MHIHTNCKISAIAYLKTPKQQVRNRKEHYQSDGKVTFSNNTGTDLNFANYQCSFEPVLVICMFFHTTSYVCLIGFPDPNDERVSISFNADTTTKSSLDKQTKEQENV